METAPTIPTTVLILKADQLYAETLRQFTRQVFPTAAVQVAATVGAATKLLTAHRIDLLISGLAAEIEGDVLDLLLRYTRHPGGPRHVLIVTSRRAGHILLALRRLAVGGIFNPSTESPEAFMFALRTVASGA